MITQESPFEKQPPIKKGGHFIVGLIMLLALVICWPIATKYTVLILTTVGAINFHIFAIANTGLNEY